VSSLTKSKKVKDVGVGFPSESGDQVDGHAPQFLT
jgi:hypothetical protein